MAMNFPYLDKPGLSYVIGKIKDKFVRKTDIATNLTTQDDTKVLSAKQGYKLNSNIGNLSSLPTTAKSSTVAAITELNENKVDKNFGTNAGFHNSIYRGKNLGSFVTAAQWAAIQSGTFEDLFIGDYWLINSIIWRIAAFDYWFNHGNTACLTHHVVIVPDGNLLNADGSTTHWMNITDTTTGAYVGSNFYTGANSNTGKAQCRSKAQNAFGSGHILIHREYLQNAANGYATAGAWYDSDIEMMNEQMVFGCRVFGDCLNQGNIPAAYTIDTAQLPLFALDHSRICNRALWWLRDVTSASRFAIVASHGYATYLGPSDPLVGVRPAFGIC